MERFLSSFQEIKVSEKKFIKLMLGYQWCGEERKYKGLTNPDDEELIFRRSAYI
jgi:hypothetical protein